MLGDLPEPERARDTHSFRKMRMSSRVCTVVMCITRDIDLVMRVLRVSAGIQRLVFRKPDIETEPGKRANSRVSIPVLTACMPTLAARIWARLDLTLRFKKK